MKSNQINWEYQIDLIWCQIKIKLTLIRLSKLITKSVDLSLENMVPDIINVYYSTNKKWIKN